MRKRSRVLSAASLGLALVCSGHPVVAAPVSATSEAAQPEKKRTSGSFVLWVALGAAFVALAAAAAQRRHKSGPGV